MSEHDKTYYKAEKKDEREAHGHSHGHPRGRTLQEHLAFSLQTSLACMATDWIDPIVGTAHQVRRAGGIEGVKSVWGLFGKNLAGEFSGDIIGGFATGALEYKFEPQMHKINHIIGLPFSPIYNVIAPHVVKGDKEDPDYKLRVKEWKQTQQDALGNVLLFNVLSTVFNIALQRGTPKSWGFIHNSEATARTIAEGKVQGVALTMGLVLPTRAFLPDQTAKFDDWLEEKIVNPLVTPVGKALGADMDAARAAEDERQREKDERKSERKHERKDERRASRHEARRDVAEVEGAGRDARVNPQTRIDKVGYDGAMQPATQQAQLS